MYSFQHVIHLAVVLLDHRSCMYSALEILANRLPKYFTPIYTSINSTWVFHLFHILNNTRHFLSFFFFNSSSIDCIAPIQNITGSRKVKKINITITQIFGPIRNKMDVEIGIQWLSTITINLQIISCDPKRYIHNQ